jgi:hypothetical protein
VGRETTSSGAGHTGGELDDDEIEGIERLQTAFEELKTHITKAWNDEMSMVADSLAFTKINTLMTVARGAADRVIETSARFVREAKEKTPHNLDAQGYQTQQCVAPIHLLEENAYGVVRYDHEDHNTEGVPAEAEEFNRNKDTQPGVGPDGKTPQRPTPDPPDIRLDAIKDTEEDMWRSVWPSLVEGDGRFLPNPKETIRPPTQHWKIKHHLTIEPSTRQRGIPRLPRHPVGV